MIKTVIEFRMDCERYVEEYMLRDKTNASTAKARIAEILRLLDVLSDVETLEGSAMSARAPYMLNIGTVVEMLVCELFNRLNGYGSRVHLSMSYGSSDIQGRGSNTYEVKYHFSNKYRATALCPSSPAKYVYFCSSSKKAVYKLPYEVALEIEEAYGKNASKHRCINIDLLEDADSYILKTYTEALFG